MQNHNSQALEAHQDMKNEWGEITQERAQFEIEIAEQQRAIKANLICEILDEVESWRRLMTCEKIGLNPKWREHLARDLAELLAPKYDKLRRHWAEWRAMSADVSRREYAFHFNANNDIGPIFAPPDGIIYTTD